MFSWFLPYGALWQTSSSVGGADAASALTVFQCSCTQSKTISAISAQARAFPSHGCFSAGTQGTGEEGRELSPMNNAGHWLCVLQHFSFKPCPINVWALHHLCTIPKLGGETDGCCPSMLPRWAGENGGTHRKSWSIKSHLTHSCIYRAIKGK